MTRSHLSKARLGMAGAAFIAVFGGLLSLGAAVVQSSPAAAIGPTTGAYFPLTPVRIYDSRSTSNVGGGVTLAKNGVDVVNLTSAVPAGATAVVLNVTAVNATAASYFTVFPTGDASALQAGNVGANFSDLNFVPGAAQPNLVTSPIGTGNSVSIYNFSGTTDVVVDLEGYYGTPTSDAGQFFPLTPARITDTRAASTYPNSGMTLGPDSTLPVQVTGVGGVPATGVSAVELNVTATNTSAASFFTVYPAGGGLPLASNLNWNAGTTIPNRVVVPVGAGGVVDIYNYVGTADAVVDVDGYFSDNTYTGDAGSYYSSVTPARISDTRAGSTFQNAGHTLAALGTEAVQVSGAGGVPAIGPGTSVTAAVLNVTEATSSAGGFLTVFPAAATRPGSSDLNFLAGDVIANSDMVGLSSTGAINVFNWSGNTDVVVDVFGFYLPLVPPTVNSVVVSPFDSPPADGQTMTPFTVTVTDPTTAPVSGDTVTLAVTPSTCGTVSPTSGTTNGSGVLSAVYTSSVFASSCLITATEDNTGGTGATGFAQTPLSGYATSLSANPSTLGTGQMTTLSVAVSDLGNGAAANGDKVNFTTNGAGSCNVAPGQVTVNAGGTATASYTTTGTAGACIITATEVNGGTSDSVTVTS
jgi:hypothetical protein